MKAHLTEKAESLRLKIDSCDQLNPKLLRDYEDFLLEVDCTIESQSMLVQKLNSFSRSLDQELKELCLLRNFMSKKGKK